MRQSLRTAKAPRAPRPEEIRLGDTVALLAPWRLVSLGFLRVLRGWAILIVLGAGCSAAGPAPSTQPASPGERTGLALTAALVPDAEPVTVPFTHGVESEWFVRDREVVRQIVPVYIDEHPEDIEGYSVWG